jgi:hypothetical protein
MTLINLKSMKSLKYFIFAILVFSGIYFYSCDDAGQIPTNMPKGQVSFGQNNLKPLDQTADGVYQLWIALDTANQREWFSAGRFNVTSQGGLVAEGGGTLTLNFSGDTNRLHLASHSLVTLEKDNDGAPSPYRIISGPLTISGDKITGDLKMSGAEALGNLGITLGAAGPPYASEYILNSPTTNNANCLQGLWFCDTAGVSHFNQGNPGGAGALTITGGWVYQAWLINNQTQGLLSIGRFTNFTGPDGDGAGPCAGTGPSFSKPGQDWINAASCPPGVSNLNNGTYGVFITMEPATNDDAAPFFLKLFKRDVIQSSLHCGERDIFFQSMAALGLLPSGSITITF